MKEIRKALEKKINELKEETLCIEGDFNGRIREGEKK